MRFEAVVAAGNLRLGLLIEPLGELLNERNLSLCLRWWRRLAEKLAGKTPSSC